MNAKLVVIMGNVDSQYNLSGIMELDEGFLCKLVVEHRPKLMPKKLINNSLPCGHIAIDNDKRIFFGYFSQYKPNYLQNYLNKFCYKFNRCYFGEAFFNRLLVACVNYKNEFR